MEIMVNQAKRIKLEHSYAYDDEIQPITIKREDPPQLSQDNGLQTIKIEIGDASLIKSEPPEPIPDAANENCDFEYMNVPNEIKNEIFTAPSVAQVENTASVINSATLDNSVASRDPLELSASLVNDEFASQVNNEFVGQEILLDVRKPRERRKTKNGKDLPSETQSKSYLRLQKERDNFQKQTKKLKEELKNVKMREKALQTELGARRMSEIYLKKKNMEMKDQMQQTVKKEKMYEWRINDVTQRLVLAEKERSTIKSETIEKVKKDYNEVFEKLKLQQKIKEADYKQVDMKCAKLTHTLACVNAKYLALNKETEVLKHKSAAMELSHKTSLQALQHVEQRARELGKELALVRRSNEELQKSLLTEKKMSRFFINERDKLLEEQDKRFREADKELVNLKYSVNSLTKLLAQKSSECKSQKDLLRVMSKDCHRKQQEIKSKMEELEKKELELSKKVCEYCGF